MTGTQRRASVVAENVSVPSEFCGARVGIGLSVGDGALELAQANAHGHDAAAVASVAASVGEEEEPAASNFQCCR